MAESFYWVTQRDPELPASPRAIALITMGLAIACAVLASGKATSFGDWAFRFAAIYTCTLLIFAILIWSDQSLSKATRASITIDDRGCRGRIEKQAFDYVYSGVLGFDIESFPSGDKANHTNLYLFPIGSCTDIKDCDVEEIRWTARYSEQVIRMEVPDEIDSDALRAFLAARIRTDRWGDDADSSTPTAKTDLR